ncbi:hypothetical protein [Anaerophilus nitritogenes]|uniref:hypothetical protein n=1 Tax=Anaerophilus nitritogenes TaxID=2498136 RepID=UPI00101BD491|nr:hypothetical protein [Anaerophilus nitritogenes]
MEDLQYRKTEGILYSHFRRKKRINRIKYDIESTKHSIHKIQQDLQNVNIELSDCMKAIDYSQDRVQSSSETVSAMEREMERITDKLLNELTYKVQKKFKLNARLRNIEAQVKRIQSVLDELTEEEASLIELKYNGLKTYRQIAYDLHCDVATVKRRKDKLIEYIASELE